MKRIRYNNAGENKGPLKEVCDPFNVSIKYTAPNTPQYNGIVEWKFVTMGQWANAMLKASPIDKSLHKELWGEDVLTAMHLHNCAVQQGKNR